MFNTKYKRAMEILDIQISIAMNMMCYHEKRYDETHSDTIFKEMCRARAEYLALCKLKSQIKREIES